MILRTVALGLGALATQLTWATYNAYLPLLYGRFTQSNTLIGLIMVLDNVFAVLLVPYVAARSDQVTTRWGRRIPFLAAGMPITALCLLLVPRTASVASLLATTLLMNVGLALAAGPMMALMPDITPDARRGRANGIINALAGCGALIAFFVLAPLSRRQATVPFDGTGLVVVAALIVIALVIRERRDALTAGGDPSCAAPAERVQVAAAAGRGRVLAAVHEASRIRPLALLGLQGFCAVAAVNGVQNMFTRFGVHQLGLDAAGATTLLGFFVLTFIAGAVPAGAAGDRYGRVGVMRTGLAGTFAAFLLAQAVRTPGPFVLVLLLGGLAWALYLNNAYPVLLQLIPSARVGLYSGLWSAVSAVGGLVAPPIYGWTVDALGFGAFFLPGVGFMGIALACGLALRVDGATPPGAARLAYGSQAHRQDH
ncbi:MAG: MFS transporter [Armatimonadota bacterium]|nr:MFS transporter [Armatimonadota bacterium]MDR7534009.1 MFS transporter [Armatimonadota bacterium]MDR7536540.1 MFS transporter [Armatimonadota bacterium]